jgi:hypothetical protein
MERPLADASREVDATSLFPFREMSPEEYAARHGADWACFSFHEFQYRNAELDVWIQKLGRIFLTPGRLQQCREEFLSPEELKRVQERLEEAF